MHKNPDYSNLFRGRPFRFILPLKDPPSNLSIEHNLISVNNVYQQSDTFNDKLDGKRGMVEKKDENKSENKEEGTKEKKLFEKNAAAFKLSSGEIFVKPELLCDLGCETPRINNQSHLGKEYRFFYAISSDVDIENPGTVCKCISCIESS